MKYIKKSIIILTAVIGFFLIFSTKNEVQAKTVSHSEEISTQMLEKVRASKLKVIATPQVKVKTDPNEQDISKYYYNQLKHEISRNTYNTLVTELKNDIVVSISNYEYSIDESTEEKVAECFNNNIVPYVLDGYEAYIMDGAKNYWWTPDGIKIGYKDATLLDDKVIFKYVEIASPVQEWSNYDDFNTKLKQVSNSITGKTTYEIVRAINYYICNNVDYTIIDDTDIEQTAYGALILNKAVCEGQTQLFNLLCREKGIISINVYGYTSTTSTTTAHAWNYVYEPKKKQWYAVDVTWNNQFDDILYLMIGSQTEINGDNFNKNHIPGFKQYVLQTYTPITPVLATEKYIEPITIDENYMKNIQPNTTYNDFIKEFSSDIVFTVKEGEKIISGTDIIKTGQTYMIGDVLAYTLVVTGDVNGDGRANINDILDINMYRLNKKQLAGAYLKSADANKDGQTDIKDLLQVNQYRLEKINEF